MPKIRRQTHQQRLEILFVVIAGKEPMPREGMPQIVKTRLVKCPIRPADSQTLAKLVEVMSDQLILQRDASGRCKEIAVRCHGVMLTGSFHNVGAQHFRQLGTDRAGGRQVRLLAG